MRIPPPHIRVVGRLLLASLATACVLYPSPLSADPAARPGLVLQTGHHGDVNSVAFSPDGQILASGSKDGTVRLWVVATGELKRTLDAGTNAVQAVAFSSDGELLAAGSMDEKVRLWNSSTGELKQTLDGHPGGVRSVAFSPDGKLLAVGTNGICGKTEGGIEATVWNLATGTVKWRLQPHPGTVHSVAFSPDGSVLAAGTYREVRLWDARTGRSLRSLGNDVTAAYSIAFSPDGKLLADAGFHLRIWDVSTGRIQQRFKTESDGFIAAAFSPDGRHVAVGTERLRRPPRILIWDLQRGDLVRTFAGHTAHVHSVAYSPDGKVLASGSRDRTLRLWNSKSGDLKRGKCCMASKTTSRQSPGLRFCPIRTWWQATTLPAWSSSPTQERESQRRRSTRRMGGHTGVAPRLGRMEGSSQRPASTPRLSGSGTRIPAA